MIASHELQPGKVDEGAKSQRKAFVLRFLGLDILVEGTLGKPEGRLRFTNIVLKPTVNIARHEDSELANRLLERAEEGCLIARSLACPVQLEALALPAEILAG